MLKKIFKKVTKLILNTSDYLLNLLRYLNPYLYFFYFKNLKFSKDTQSRINKKYPIIDNRIIFRMPKLKFNEDKLLILDTNLYSSESEVREDGSPYFDYFRTLEKTFNFEKINSFLDVGCSTGWVMYYLFKNYKTDVKGIEYFDYHKKYSDKSIKEDIIVNDLRSKIELGKKFDIVNCTEVGEHIEPAALDIFISNLLNHTKKYLILTWSSTYPPKGGPPQHVSSLKYGDFVTLIESYGLKKNTELTDLFRKNSLKYKDFYFWWRDSITVFEKIN